MIPETRRTLNLSGVDIPIARAAPQGGAATILVADADPHLRDIYRTLLAHHGYRTIEAADGLDAIEAVRELRPDAALLDMDLPHLNGLEAAGLLRSHPTTAGTPLIMLSIYADPLVHVRAVRAGCVGYVEKPFEPGALVGEVRRVLLASTELGRTA